MDILNWSCIEFLEQKVCCSQEIFKLYIARANVDNISVIPDYK